MRRHSPRGFALMDYLAGTIILTGAMISFTSLHSIKSKAVHMARHRQRASFAAQNHLRRLERGLRSEPTTWKSMWTAAQSKPVGTWAPQSRFSVEGLARIDGQSVGTVEVRRHPALEVSGSLELRVRLQWNEDQENFASHELSTVIGGGS